MGWLRPTIICVQHYPLPPGCVTRTKGGDYISAHQHNLSRPDPNKIVPSPRSRESTSFVVVISRNFCIRERHENWDCGHGVVDLLSVWGFKFRRKSGPVLHFFYAWG